MSNHARLTLLAAASALVASCTGTVELSPPAQFALLTKEGEALRTFKLIDDAESNRLNPDLGEAEAVEQGRDLVVLAGGRSFALVRAEAIEGRSPDLALNFIFEPPPFEACWKTAVGEPAGETLFALSECEGGAQNVALYNKSGRLLWWTDLPAGSALDTGAVDQPPLRLGLIGRVGVVARPALGGGSEMMRVAEVAGSTEEGADNEAEVSTPVTTLAVRDLTTYRQGNAATIYAATDQGVFPLTAAGVPAAEPLPAFGTLRYDRIWATSANVQDAPLLLAYRGQEGYHSGRQDLRVWNGKTTEANAAVVMDTLSDVQDIALSEGYLYVLTSYRISRYDALLGLGQNRWPDESLGVAITGGRELVELVPESE